MTVFRTLGLPEPILVALSQKGYDTPTPIQEQAIPAVLEGRDLLAIAQTGTGKTASFALPILAKLLEDRKRAAKGKSRALILAPTRELAAQILDSIREYGRQMRFSACLVVGGVKAFNQIRALEKGVDIIVATPGRLQDHMRAGITDLLETEIVVLDEADQMMDFGFLPAIRQILSEMPKSRQTILFSATMPKPIAALAREFLQNPAEVTIAPQATPIAQIDQQILAIRTPAKAEKLVELMRGEAVRRAIVFTRTKRGAERLAKMLNEAEMLVDAIHGDKNQAQRGRVLQSFRNGRINILVATDVAARGIDIDDVTHVVNYELPLNPEAYVHRIGRTGRAGKSGVAISLVDRSEVPLLRDIDRLSGLNLSEGVWPDVKNIAGPSPSKRFGRGAGKPAGAGAGGRSRPARGGDFRPERSNDARPERKFDARPERGGEARVERKFDARPERKFETRLERNSEARPERKFEARPARKFDEKADTRVGFKSTQDRPDHRRPVVANDRRPQEFGRAQGAARSQTGARPQGEQVVSADRFKNRDRVKGDWAKGPERAKGGDVFKRGESFKKADHQKDAGPKKNGERKEFSAKPGPQRKAIAGQGVDGSMPRQRKRA